MLFAMAGAMMLRTHYKAEAWPVAGAAAYMLDRQTSIVATFGKIEKNFLVSAPDAFHCWIQCNGYAIDFMAPVFPETLKAAGVSARIARNMFQRPIADSARFVPDLVDDRAFALLPDVGRTRAIFEYFEAHACAFDLVHICCEWYRPPPKRISETMDIADDLGRIERLRLGGPTVTGVW
jgi:hypothetical protein